MTDYTVSAPAASAWEVGDIAAAALERLRLLTNDVDADRVTLQAAVACERIDDFIDRPESDDDPVAPTPKMVEAATALTVELYGGGAVSIAAGADGALVVSGVRVLVRTDRQRFGIA